MSPGRPFGFNLIFEHPPFFYQEVMNNPSNVTFLEKNASFSFISTYQEWGQIDQTETVSGERGHIPSKDQSHHVQGKRYDQHEGSAFWGLVLGTSEEPLFALFDGNILPLYIFQLKAG